MAGATAIAIRWLWPAVWDGAAARWSRTWADRAHLDRVAVTLRSFRDTGIQALTRTLAILADLARVSPAFRWAGVAALTLLVGTALWMAVRARRRKRESGRTPGPEPATLQSLRGGRIRRVRVGIDPGRDSLKLVAVGPRRGSTQILAQITVPARAGRGAGTGPDSARLTDALPEALARLGRRGVRGALGVDQHGVILRTPEFPPMPARDLHRAVRFTIPDLIPIPVDEAAWDFVPLGIHDPGGQPRLRVLVAAVPERLVSPQVRAAVAAGVRVTAVHVDCLAAYRALEALGLLPAGPGPLVLVDLGAAATRLSIFVGGVPELTRTIPQGGDDLTRAVQDVLGVSPDEARARKEQAGLLGDTPVAAVLESALTDLFGEVWRTLEYFLRQAQPRAAVPLFVYGGTSRMPGLDAHLARFLDDRVRERFGDHPGFDVRWVGEDPGDGRDPVDPRFLVALGLALDAGSPSAPGVRLNLLPREWRDAGRRRLRRAAAALLAGVGVAGLVGGGVAVRATVDRLEARLAALRRENAALAEAVRVREQVQAAERLEAARAEFVESQRAEWRPSDVLAGLPQRLPSGVAIDRLEVAKDGRVTVEGRAPDVRSVAQLAVNLRAGGRFGDADVRFPQPFAQAAGEAGGGVRFAMTLSPAGKGEQGKP
ncbi:pilus assembly protein PilM [Caldinitratiruptor microaerophilus]|uniref:Type IV pilus assembly protein PilM n=1 Tax=Caldinitratiruptor microaerophilus TaxID=671077 RepID=A0AA35G8A8_9FIRM|nr:pilus assembly protein PilM [Caldinitratiruptor microaerophilus]BDG60876.1 hypothetical protein caldi_19660 [Caldinitratiruptor microaerophilus]